MNKRKWARRLIGLGTTAIMAAALIFQVFAALPYWPEYNYPGHELTLRVSGDKSGGALDLGVLQADGVTMQLQGDMFDIDRMLPGETAYGRLYLKNEATFPVMIKVRVLEKQNGIQTTDFLDKLDIRVYLDRDKVANLGGVILDDFPAKGSDGLCVKSGTSDCQCPNDPALMPNAYHVESREGACCGDPDCCYETTKKGVNPAKYTSLGWLKAGATASLDVEIEMLGRDTPGWDWDKARDGHVLTWKGDDEQMHQYDSVTYQEEKAWLQWWFCVEMLVPPTSSTLPPPPSDTGPEPPWFPPDSTTLPPPTIPSEPVPEGVETPTVTPTDIYETPPPLVVITPTQTPPELTNETPPPVIIPPTEMPQTGEAPLWPRVLAGILLASIGLFIIAKRPRKEEKKDGGDTAIPS